MTSESRKDSAAQAYTLGLRAFRQKNFEKAEKYLKKSLNYHKTREAQHLLSNIEALKSKQEKHRRQHQSTPQYQPPKQEAASAAVKDPEIRRIINEKDYYALFGIDQDFTEKNLTKKYRKLAMKFHPDRNQQPGAEDAFKKIASAYECLKDPQKRRLYDQYGTDAPELQQMNHQFRDMHPEDIIRMFGFTNFSSHGGGTGGQQNPLKALLSFFPMLMFLGYSFLSTTTYQEPNQFSLHKTPEFPIARQHSEEEIQFFVNRRFSRMAQTRPNFLRNVEDKVEGKYLEELVKACKKERKNKQSRIFEASKSRGEKMAEVLKAAYELREKSCEKYEEYILSK